VRSFLPRFTDASLFASSGALPSTVSIGELYAVHNVE
jgi:hypothetical protein